jgi:hypothetical protein
MDRILAYVGGGLALGAGVFWWLHRDEPGALLDKLADAVVTLTSSEADRLEQLEPVTQEQVRGLVAELERQGVGIYIGQTLRSSAQEKALVDAGRTAGSLKISWHQLGRAVDLYPLDADGKPDRTGTNLEAIRAIASTAEALGFRQLAFNADGSKHLLTNAEGRKIWDSGHVEWRAPYDSIAAAVSAEGERFGLA